MELHTPVWPLSEIDGYQLFLFSDDIFAIPFVLDFSALILSHSLLFSCLYHKLTHSLSHHFVTTHTH